MAVHLGDNNGTKISTLLKCPTLCLSSLAWSQGSVADLIGVCSRITYASIEDQNRHVGLDGFSDLYHFLEQFRFLLVTTRSVDDDHFKSLFLEFCNTLGCNGDWIRFSVGTKVGYFSLGCRLSGLIKSTCAEGIRTDNTRLEATFLIVDSQFCACCSLSISLGFDVKL